MASFAIKKSFALSIGRKKRKFQRKRHVRKLTLNDVARHQGGGVVVALQKTVGQVAFDLEAEEVTGELLLELGRIRGVELYAEPEERVDQRQPHLTANWFLEIQPVL